MSKTGALYSLNRIPIEFVRGRFRYEPETGRFFLRSSGGQEVGSRSESGYVVLSFRIARKQVVARAHRVAWAIVHGQWPATDIDHINGDRADNRLANLRPATRSQNCANSNAARGVSGLRGVTYHRQCKKWAAQTQAGGRTKRHLGLFDTREEAFAAYVMAVRTQHDGFEVPRLLAGAV